VISLTPPAPADQAAWYQAGEHVWVEDWISLSTAAAVVVDVDWSGFPRVIDVTVEYSVGGGRAVVPIEQLVPERDHTLRQVQENHGPTPVELYPEAEEQL
jgi:hypothetical protein